MKRLCYLIVILASSFISLHAAVIPVTIENPDSWNASELTPYIGKTIQFQNPMYIVNNYSMQKGSLSISPRRIKTPTGQVLPGTTEYRTMVSENKKAHVYLSLPADFYRMGERIEKLTVRVESTSQLQAQGDIITVGNPRNVQHDPIGDYTLKVCGFNLQYYLASDYGDGFGPDNDAEAAIQHEKILKAIMAIDADIYALCEIQQGQAAMSKLTNAMNSASGTANRYAFINDGSSSYGSYTKVGYIYRTDKVAPYKSLQNNNTSLSHRKKIQGFRQESNDEIFLLSINHFKSKSGCDNAVSSSNTDQGDGQGCHNGTRVREAASVVEMIEDKASYFQDPDVLILGDLNAYAYEDPVMTFIDNGYTDLMRAFHADSAYSYAYYNRNIGAPEVGYLDHALASASMRAQITGVTAYHINTDEHSSYGYGGYQNDRTQFRCSDHDPVIVGIALGGNSDTGSLPFLEKVKVNVGEYLAGLAPLTIQNAENALLYVYNTAGTPVLNDQIRATSYVLDTTTLSSGVHVMNIFGEKTMKQVKFIVK